MDGHAQGVVLKGSKSKWEPVMCGVPQESVLGLALLSIFVGYMDSGTDAPPARLLTAPVDMLEGKDLDRLTRK